MFEFRRVNSETELGDLRLTIDHLRLPIGSVAIPSHSIWLRCWELSNFVSMIVLTSLVSSSPSRNLAILSQLNALFR
jgi:hypothetical protein